MTSPIDPVLVVEDSDLLRDAICRLLAMRGHGVAGARDGQEAWEYLERGGRVSCIVLDLALPRMDGRRFRAKLLDDERYARIPVVVFTGTNDGLSNVVAVIRKMDPDALLDAVDRAARRFRPQLAGWSRWRPARRCVWSLREIVSLSERSVGRGERRASN